MFRTVAITACVVLVVIAVASIVGMRISSARFNRVFDRPITRTCVSCHGRGWLVDQQRSLDFQDGAFVNRPSETRICPACQGTGTLTQR